MRAYLCVTIDCECDKGPGWRLQKPLVFSGISQGIGDRLQPLFRRFRAKPTYLLSPEVLRDGQSLEVLTGLEGEAELGSHLHGEFAEPGAFVPDVTSAFQCNYDRETEQQKLRYLTDSFRVAFGRPPRSFRAGRFGIGRHSLELLRDLGYTVDSSVAPHMNGTRMGAPEATFLNAPTQPYRPNPHRPELSAPLSDLPLEVPVTIRPGRFAGLPFVGTWAGARWLRPTRASIDQLVKVAQEEIDEAQVSGLPIVLNCMFHNVEVVPRASPYAQNKAQADAIFERLAGLLAWADREGIGSLGLSDVPELFARSDTEMVCGAVA